jgi:hypothetical protein
MGIVWLADVKSYFSFYFKRLSVHDVYDIGTRLSMNNAMSLRYAMAGELLCSNARTNAAWTSPVVRSCRDKTVVSAIAGTDIKLSSPAKHSMRNLYYLNLLAVWTPGWANPMFRILEETRNFCARSTAHGQIISQVRRARSTCRCWMSTPNKLLVLARHLFKRECSLHPWQKVARHVTRL